MYVCISVCLYVCMYIPRGYKAMCIRSDARLWRVFLLYHNNSRFLCICVVRQYMVYMVYMVHMVYNYVYYCDTYDI
jgi:hypothetical protein